MIEEQEEQNRARGKNEREREYLWPVTTKPLLSESAISNWVSSFN